MEMDAVHHARRRSDAPAGTLHRVASPLLPRTLRRYRGMDGERVVGSAFSRVVSRRRNPVPIANPAICRRTFPVAAAFAKFYCGRPECAANVGRRRIGETGAALTCESA